MTTCPACGHTFTPPVRSTGHRSQNHALHGFADQIARKSDSGCTKSEILDEAKRRAALPHYMNVLGGVVFKHESDWTKEEASKVIDCLHEIAEFLGVTLVEVNE